MTLVYLVLAWLAGIALAAGVDAAWWLWLLCALPPLAGVILARNSMWRVGYGCVLLLTLGAARMEAATPHFGEADLAYYNDSGFVTLEGMIVDAPDVRDTQILLRVRAEQITLPDGNTRSIKGLVLIETPRVGSFRYGDHVQIRGELDTPPVLETFSYRDYLAREGVYSLMRYSQVEVVGERGGNPVRRVLLDFRERAHQIILRLLPDPQASLLAGILLGIESGISPDVKGAFNAVGATHVIVISGSNLAILGGLMWSVSRRFVSENIAAAITIAGILLYAAFVGGDAAVMRAAIMTSMGLIGTRLGRESYGPTALAFAALLLTAIQPNALLDVGFQLSFLATLGLILWVTPMQNALNHWLGKFIVAEKAEKIIGALSDALLVTLAAQIATTPIIAYHFERFSILSLPVNFLIIPIQPYIMIFGGIGVLAAMIFAPLGQVILWGSWLCLSYTTFIVRLFAQIPFVSAEVRLSLGAVIAIYAVLFGGAWITMQTHIDQRRWLDGLGRALSVKILGLLGLAAAILLFTAGWQLPDHRLHVTFIDVGGGTATLIETPSGRHILVDAGGSGRRLSTALGDALPFWERRLDLVIITQPTQAHLSGLLPIVSRYQIDAIMTNGVHGSSELSGALWAELEAKGVPELIAQPGMRIVVEDGVTITVLQTQTSLLPEGSDESGTPIMLLVEYEQARFLITADLSIEDEAHLLASGQRLDATVLQVPRAGHREVNSEAFLAAVQPQISIIPIPAGNREDLPHGEVLDRLEAVESIVYRLAETGTMRVITDGDRLWIYTNP